MSEPTVATMPVIEALALGKTFRENDGHQLDILQNLNFRVEAGEAVAIVGASGSGKSTLLHLLAGLDNPSSGQLRLMGREWQAMNETERGHWRNQHLGFVYQFHHLLPEFSALENVMMPLIIRGTARAQARARAEALLVEVGLQQRLQHRPGQLSGGERQRVAIARALSGQPQCVLADEPTGNLDGPTARAVFERLLQVKRDENVALLLVTHDPALAAQCDRSLRLQDGVLLEEVE